MRSDEIERLLENLVRRLVQEAGVPDLFIPLCQLGRFLIRSARYALESGQEKADLQEQIMWLTDDLRVLEELYQQQLCRECRTRLAER